MLPLESVTKKDFINVVSPAMAGLKSICRVCPVKECKYCPIGETLKQYMTEEDRRKRNGS